MKRYAACCLLLACPLRYATAQSVKPLPPLVVQLLPGDVVQGRLIGLDSATFYRMATLVPAADAALADYQRENTLLRAQAAASADELRATRAALAQQEKDYQRQLAAGRQIAGKRPAPLLLDQHTYTGFAIGAVAALLFLVFHQQPGVATQTEKPFDAATDVAALQPGNRPQLSPAACAGAASFSSRALLIYGLLQKKPWQVTLTGYDGSSATVLLCGANDQQRGGALYVELTEVLGDRLAALERNILRHEQDSQEREGLGPRPAVLNYCLPMRRLSNVEFVALPAEARRAYDQAEQLEAAQHLLRLAPEKSKASPRQSLL